MQQLTFGTMQIDAQRPWWFGPMHRMCRHRCSHDVREVCAHDVCLQFGERGGERERSETSRVTIREIKETLFLLKNLETLTTWNLELLTSSKQSLDCLTKLRTETVVQQFRGSAECNLLRFRSIERDNIYNIIPKQGLLKTQGARFVTADHFLLLLPLDILWPFALQLWFLWGGRS